MRPPEAFPKYRLTETNGAAETRDGVGRELAATLTDEILETVLVGCTMGMVLPVDFCLCAL